MQQVQSLRQQIGPLQEEAEDLQIKCDKISLTPEIQRIQAKLQELKETKDELDGELQNIRKSYTPSIKSEIDVEVTDLKRQFFLESESLEVIQEKMSKKNVETKEFYERDPAKSILEAQKRTTDLSHRLNFLYKESAEIDVDFEETFNPSYSNIKKENRRVTYLKRKLQLAQEEVEKRKETMKQMKIDHEREKRMLLAKKDEEERKRKIRAEMSKNRRREFIAQQRKAAGYSQDQSTDQPQGEANQNYDANKDTVRFENDANNNSSYSLKLQSPPKQAGPKRLKKRTPRKKSPNSSPNQNLNESTKTAVSQIDQSRSSISPKSERGKQRNSNQNQNSNIFGGKNYNKVQRKKEDFTIDEERDEIQIDGSDDDEMIEDIEIAVSNKDILDLGPVIDLDARKKQEQEQEQQQNEQIEKSNHDNEESQSTLGEESKENESQEATDENEQIKIGDDDEKPIVISDDSDESDNKQKDSNEDEIVIKDEAENPEKSGEGSKLTLAPPEDFLVLDVKPTLEFSYENGQVIPRQPSTPVSTENKIECENESQLSNKEESEEKTETEENEKQDENEKEKDDDIENNIQGGTTAISNEDEEIKKEESTENMTKSEEEENESIDDVLKKAAEGMLPSDHEETEEKKNGLIGWFVYEIPDQSKSEFSSQFDSIILMDIPWSPLFEKLGRVLKEKGVASAGKFNNDVL
ncbi:hypothetical protein TRFO_37068 [Tritrichomonas foetus]|uniref:Uncharacterized protein n=1 Tax=Tritrichomonas foetus TaxID=1144522 RepID=A0A1J4JC11_9EUKA|nr:hypothetical protein TRFO_37068 [Tritrichomonas foetus]|eukprot:OHS96726.1 hypothetical protein TRFO_37068 [Tritrichomonas foetus]